MTARIYQFPKAVPDDARSVRPSVEKRVGTSTGRSEMLTTAGDMLVHHNYHWKHLVDLWWAVQQEPVEPVRMWPRSVRSMIEERE